MFKYLNKFWTWLVYALALFPLLPRGIESILMITFFLCSAILYFANKKDTNCNQIINVLLLSVVFSIYIIGLLYSTNFLEALGFIKKVLPILGFPLIFGIFKRNTIGPKEINKILTIYVLSLLVGLLINEIEIYKSIGHNSISAWQYRQLFEKLTDVHGTYYSIWLSLGVITLFMKLIREGEKMRSAIIFLILIYFIYWQIKLGARAPLLITFLLLFILVITQLKAKLFLKTLFYLFISLVFFFIIKPKTIHKIKEIKNYEFSLPKGDYHIEQGKITNEQIRYGIYYCSMSLIKQNWLVGVGIGDIQDKLNYCYDHNIDSNVYKIFTFNTHNQYLHILLSSGIFGLLLFLLSLLIPVYVALKSSNYLYLSFTILIILSLLTENVMSRHDGVLFYSFFNSIFFFSSLEKVKK